jgi:hypothetical protein
MRAVGGLGAGGVFEGRSGSHRRQHRELVGVTFGDRDGCRGLVEGAGIDPEARPSGPGIDVVVGATIRRGIYLGAALRAVGVGVGIGFVAELALGVVAVRVGWHADQIRTIDARCGDRLCGPERCGEESPVVKLQRLSATDGFIVFDLDAATTWVGIARLAPKVLQDGATLLARSATYSFASFSVAGHSGGSAGINAKPEDRDGAVKAFVEEVRPLAESGRLRLAPGLGLTADDLAPLGWTEPDAALAAAGALAAAEVAGPLDGRTAAVVGSAPVAAAATDQLTAAGADVAPARFDAECDVLFVAGKAGVLDHPTAEGVKATTIVPLTPVPVTARALAVLGRQERVVVPDFLSIAAPLLTAHDPDGGDPVQRIRDATVELVEQGPGLWLAAAQRAEARLAAWTAEKPFGRPLA